MKSELEIETDRPGELSKIIGKSLDGNHQVSYQVQEKTESLIVKVETNGLGSLRGCTDTVFRLTSLAEKLY